MAKNTSVTLGSHFDRFIARLIERGRYGTVDEVIRAGLRLLEDYEAKVTAVQQALLDGESSGDAGELDIKTIKVKARARN